jgi:hypothetical protein
VKTNCSVWGIHSKQTVKTCVNVLKAILKDRMDRRTLL